jgi:hypothetical protein
MKEIHTVFSICRICLEKVSGWKRPKFILYGLAGLCLLSSQKKSANWIRLAYTVHVQEINYDSANILVQTCYFRQYYYLGLIVFVNFRLLNRHIGSKG